MTDFKVGDRVRVLTKNFVGREGDLVNVIAMPYPYEVQLDGLSTGNTFYFDATEIERIDITWADERADVLARFTEELAKATGDGSRKRQAGAKPPWYEDDAHEGAIFSHLTKWKRGELVDPDSGAHPLVHLAWRALAIACRESGNTP